MEAREKLDHELNRAIREVNGLGKRLVGCGGDPPLADSVHVSSCSTAPPAQRKPLLGLREDLVHFRSLEESIPGADSSAFRALAKKIVPDYGGAPGNPNLAS